MGQLRIIFEGVVAIGPHYPSLPTLEIGGPLHAVMPRVERQLSRYSKFTAGPGTPPAYIPVHLPVIFTKMTAAGASRKPDDTHCGFNIWHPIRERMELQYSGPSAPSKLQFIRNVPGGQCEPPSVRWKNDPLHPIDHVADMHELWPQREQLLPGMLHSAPAPPIVAAQVFVPGGCVGSHGDDLKRDLRPDHRTSFLPPKPSGADPVSKELLPQVVVSATIDSLRIVMTSLDSGDTLDPIEFTIRGEEEIRIGNGDPRNVRYLMDHLGGCPKVAPVGFKPKGPNNETVDVDFEACYHVFRNDDGGAVPIPWVPFVFGETNCNVVTTG